MTDPEPFAREVAPPASEDKSHYAVDCGGSPIERSFDKGIQPLAPDSSEQTEARDSAYGLDVSRLPLGERSTCRDSNHMSEGVPAITLSKFSLSTISESCKDDTSNLSFVFDFDKSMLDGTASDGIPYTHESSDLRLLETSSHITTGFDQSSKTTPMQHRVTNVSTQFEPLPISTEQSVEMGPSRPAIANSLSLEKRHVPAALLSASASIRPIGVLLPNDLNEIDNLARLFYASSASDLAFRIHHIVLHQVLATLGQNQMTPQLFQVAINMTKNATTKAHYSIVADLIRNNISKRSDFLSPMTAEACVLHSYLGNSFRQRKDIRTAYKHCRLALEGYQSMPQEMQKKGSEVILATHSDMVLEAKVTHGDTIDLQKSLLAFINESYSESALELEHGPVLEELLHWCKFTLIDNDFINAVEGAAELWGKAPTSKDIEQLEITIFFWCFCLRYWREEQDDEASPSVGRARVPLVYLERRLDIEAHDSLFAMAALLVGDQPSHSESNERSKPLLVRRTLELAERTSNTSTATFRGFIAAYTSKIETECRRFSTELYQRLVQDYLVAFAESRIMLKLSECAFRDPRFRPRPPPVFLPPPTYIRDSPHPPSTLLSTPRSSWSGFASMASLTKRNKLPGSNAGDGTTLPTAGLRLSTGSSSFRRRFSIGGSAKSFRWSSAMDVDSVDCVMQE